MKAGAHVCCIVLILLVVAGSAEGQAVISAKSGLINYVEGEVTLDGQQVEVKLNSVTQLKPSQVLKTGAGRAEVLLSPGVFLRAGEDSSLKLLSDEIVNTRLEMLEGSIIVECVELPKDGSVTVLYKDATVVLGKKGLYRVDAEPAALRVYDGEATVRQGEQSQTIKKGWLLPLDGLLAAEKFDTKTGDALLRWARRRAEYIAMANPAAARMAWRDRQGFGSAVSSIWVYNPYLGMYTFVPRTGMYRSYWGYDYWSPGEVRVLYYPRVYRAPSSSAGWSRTGGAMSSRGYEGVPRTAAGTSGVAASSAPRASEPSAGSVSVPRGTGSAGARRR
ncbi:MAG TPA: hypothetical protein PLA43_13635 [Bryobacteraceae bacterium]|nr:hypothetical protein [Bryobacteraceae bacterium]HPU72995.1 hypothetical protein [Bryobacteraceae bacterium]